MMEIRCVRKEEASTLLQPNCPFCGLSLDWGTGYEHVTGFVERGECGTRWCPDFAGGAGIDRSKACEHIAKLKSVVSVSLEEIRKIEIYITGKSIVQPTHQEFIDRNFVLDEIRSKLRALRVQSGEVKP